MLRFRFAALIVMIFVALVAARGAAACEGSRCANTPEDQRAKRIILTINADGTRAAYVPADDSQPPPDLAWTAPLVGEVEVKPVDVTAFDELSGLTAPVFTAPLIPPCAPLVKPAATAPEAAPIDSPYTNVILWIFGDQQAISTNYAHPLIQDVLLRYSFGSADGTNYLDMLEQTFEVYHQYAFVTEYAQPTSELEGWVHSPLAKTLLKDYTLVTRLVGRVLADDTAPVFKLDDDLPLVSNIHEITGVDSETYWQCEGTKQNIVIGYNPSVVPPDFPSGNSR